MAWSPRGSGFSARAPAAGRFEPSPILPSSYFHAVGTTYPGGNAGGRLT